MIIDLLVPGTLCRPNPHFHSKHCSLTLLSFNTFQITSSGGVHVGPDLTPYTFVWRTFDTDCGLILACVSNDAAGYWCLILTGVDALVGWIRADILMPLSCAE